MRNLVISEGGIESTEKIVTLQKSEGYELMIFNSSLVTMILTVGNISVYIPGNSVLDEGFKPFSSFAVSGTGTDTWMWYIRS